MSTLGGAGAFNKQSSNTTDIKKISDIISTKLSNKSLTDTVQKFVSNTISSIIVENMTNIKNIVSANNNISISGGNNCDSSSSGGDLVVGNITQGIKVDSSDVSSQVSNVVSDITATVNNSVANDIFNISSDTSKKSTKDKIGSSFEGVVDALLSPIKAVGDTAKKVLDGAASCAGAFNTCSTDKLTSDSKDLQTLYGLDNNFKLSDTINTANLTDSKITKEDISAILAELTGSNELGASGICPKFIKIDKVKQFIDISSVLQIDKISKIANRVATNYITIATKVIENMNSHKTTDNTSNTYGDIPDLGNAMAGIIGATGDAASDVIKSVGTAAASVSKAGIEGVGQVLTSAIKAASSVLGALLIPIVIAIIGLIIFCIWFFLIKK